MELYLLRHAEAEETSGPDADRALTRKGREVMEDVAAAFEKTAQADVILHSPLRRARETARFVADRIPRARVVKSEALLPGASVEAILSQLSEEKSNAVLLVGHQPHLGKLLAYLVTGDARVEIPLRKACVARVSFSGSTLAPPGQLRWLISPKLAERLA